jgi:hypothetical protein
MLDYPVGAEIITYIGDKNGVIIAEIEPDIDSIPWRLNNFSSGKLQVSKFLNRTTIPDYDKFKKEYFQFGNLIAFQFTNGLPTWGGVIDAPRTFSDDALEISFYSGEYLFKFRQTDRGRYFENQTPGSMFKALIEETKNVQGFPIQTGSIWEGGTSHSPSYHLKDLFTIFTKSLTERLSNYEFDITTVIENGQIKLYANFYEMKGSDKSGKFPLIEGSNISDDFKLKEQGKIVNYWEVAGEGTEWGDTRLTSIAQDAISIESYGLRQDSKVYSDVSVQSTLDSNAATLLEKSKQPYNLYTVTATNVMPSLFENYGVGDILWLDAPSYGFEGIARKVRVKAREFYPRSGKCNLVIEDYHD